MAGAGDEWLVAGRTKKKAVTRGSPSIQVFLLRQSANNYALWPVRCTYVFI